VEIGRSKMVAETKTMKERLEMADCCDVVEFKARTAL